jgi:hypothetical protein
MPIIFKNPGRRRRNPIQLNPRRRNALRLNPMLEIYDEEDDYIDDLPMLDNPRMRRNMTREDSSRRDLMAKYRKKFGANWASNEKAYVAYYVERKQNSGSTRSKADLEAAARKNFRARK